MIKQILLISAVMLSLVSCGGGGGGAATDPAATGDFTLSTTQLIFTADVTAGTPASQNITGTLKNELPNVTVQAVVTSNVPILASIPTFTTTGTKSGFLTINPILPSILGAGTYKATISIYICSVLTNDCVNSNSQIAGSPKVVNVTYTVNGPAAAKIIVSSCTPVAGDNTQKPDGSTNIIRSHLNGSPTYKLVTTRKIADGSDVTMDYMVHEPMAPFVKPKGVMVLIAGGNLRAKIKVDPADATKPVSSSGNFLVRSAHRYQAAGYRVITIDRPSDTVNIVNADASITFGAYGDSRVGVNLDAYRNSMQHAVDIATLLKLENTEGYNVIISGTSRGSISAAAMNTLASGISMSSPLTSTPVAGLGSPVGSTKLPLSRIKRTSHILLHTNDTCSSTLPSDARTLFSNLNAMGVTTAGNEVSGGFRDTVKNDVCSGVDFHGFNGIESCAVTKETSWADALVTSLAANNAPIAISKTIDFGLAINLTANDADAGDTLSYAIPYATTSLGGTVSTNAAGVVTYTKPVAVNGTLDSFAYTVTDGKGGVSTAVISINI